MSLFLLLFCCFFLPFLAHLYNSTFWRMTEPLSPEHVQPGLRADLAIGLWALCFLNQARRDRDQQTMRFHQQNLQRSIRGSSANIAHKYFREQNTQ